MTAAEKPWFIEANNEGLRKRRRSVYYSAAVIAVLSNVSLFFASMSLGRKMSATFAVVQIALMLYMVFVVWPELEEDTEKVEAIRHDAYVADGWVKR